MAITLVQENPDGTVLIDKDGMKSVISRNMYEELLLGEGPKTDQASTHNLTPLTTKPLTPPIDKGTITPVEVAPPRKEMTSSITPTPPTEVTPPPVEAVPPAPISDKSITRQDYNRSLREGARDQGEVNKNLADIEREDAAKILDIREAENTTELERERLRTEEREVEKAERQRLYEEKKVLVKDFQKTEIKEGGWFTKGTTLQLIMAGIGNIVSLQGKSKRQRSRVELNFGIDIINNAIERDLQIQMKNITKKGANIDSQSGLIAEYIKLGESNESAYALAKATAKESVARRIDLVASQSKDARIKVSLEQASVQINADLNKELMDNAAAETLEKQKDKQLRTSAYSARTGRLNSNLAKEQFEWQKKQDVLDRSDARKAAASGAVGPAGVPADAIVDPRTGKVIGYHRGGDKDAMKMQQAMNDDSDARRKLEDYKRKWKACGRQFDGPGSESRYLKSKCKADLEQLHVSLVSAVVKANSGAGASDAEFERQFSVVPKPSTLTSGIDIGPQIDTYTKWMDSHVNRKVTGFLVDENKQVIADFDYSSHYAPIEGEDTAAAEAKEKNLRRQSADATKDVTLMGNSNEETTARFSALQTLFVQAKDGDKDALAQLEVIAGADMPTSSAAKSFLKEIDKHNTVVAKNPNVTSTDSQGRPISEKITTEDGGEGMKYYSKGKLAYISEFWAGTKKAKTTTTYENGKPSTRIYFDEDGKFIRKEKL